jgi:hypothetical protein
MKIKREIINNSSMIKQKTIEDEEDIDDGIDGNENLKASKAAERGLESENNNGKEEDGNDS